MKKKIIAIICAAVLLIGISVGVYLALCSNLFTKGSEVYVQSVSDILSYSDTSFGASSPFAGVIESQETVGVNFDSSRTLLECLVEEGTQVNAGDVLFNYDTSEQDMQLEQMNLELQRIQNSISDLNSQISSLQKEKAQALAEEQLSYTTQIQTLQSSVKQEEYNKKVKELEISHAKDNLKSSSVKAPIEGIVYKINNSAVNGTSLGNGMYQGQGDSAYITIMALGNYRIKGYINEQNIGMLSEGDEVTIRSRIDQTQTWSGKVSVIDKSAPEQNNSNGMYAEHSSANSDMLASSKYPFYVALDSYDGLMLGQHVYIEKGVRKDSDSITLSSGYVLFDEESGSYVWADNNGKLEKRAVTIGTYNPDDDSYTVISGLTLEDYIAWPESDYEEGMKTTTVNADEFTDESFSDDNSFDDDSISGENTDKTFASEDGGMLQ